MERIYDAGFRSPDRGDIDPLCRRKDGENEEGAELETRSSPDLGTICDAFDTDDAEPLPEHGDFWEQQDGRKELWG